MNNPIYHAHFLPTLLMTSNIQWQEIPLNSYETNTNHINGYLANEEKSPLNSTQPKMKKIK